MKKIAKLGRSKRVDTVKVMTEPLSIHSSRADMRSVDRVCKLLPVRHMIQSGNYIKTKAGVVVGPTSKSIDGRVVRKSTWSISDSVYFLSDGSYLNDRLSFLMTLLLSDSTVVASSADTIVNAFVVNKYPIYDVYNSDYIGDKLECIFTNGLILTVTHLHSYHMGDSGLTGISAYVYGRVYTMMNNRIPVITTDNPPYIISGKTVEVLSLTKVERRDYIKYNLPPSTIDSRVRKIDDELHELAILGDNLFTPSRFNMSTVMIIALEYDTSKEWMNYGWLNTPHSRRELLECMRYSKLLTTISKHPINRVV